MSRHSKANPKSAPPPPREREEPPAIHTEFALGSDGVLYVHADSLPLEMREGRKVFHGYALTPEEAKQATQEIHQMAFNVTVALFAGPVQIKGK